MLWRVYKNSSPFSFEPKAARVENESPWSSPLSRATPSLENEDNDTCGDSESDVSLSSRGRDRLLRYWGSLAPGFQVLGRFFPPTYSELLNSKEHRSVHRLASPSFAKPYASFAFDEPLTRTNSRKCEYAFTSCAYETLWRGRRVFHDLCLCRMECRDT